jgi:hypothetical protein
MQMGESVAMAMLLQKQGKCVICDSDEHPDPKREKIEKTAGKSGWERDKKLDGVFESGDSKRSSIYPGGSFPPSYSTEGHHCLAYTSFVQSNKDTCLRLNHFLNKVGFHPNDPPNILHLPGRAGDVKPAAPGTTAWPKGVKKEYKCFWVSVDLGKPLQLHTGRHRGTYFASSHALYRDLLRFVSDPDVCKDETMDEFKDALKEASKGAVNRAFIQVAGAKWICHPEHLRIARDLYGKTGRHSYRYAHGSGRSEAVTHVGYPGTGASPGPWPQLKLTTTPF